MMTHEYSPFLLRIKYKIYIEHFLTICEEERKETRANSMEQVFY